MDTATWQHLSSFKRWGSFDGGYPPMVKRFFAPDDGVHEVITSVIRSARQSLYVAMFGWDDAEVNALFLDAWTSKRVHVKIALDSSQAGGLGERPLLKRWPVDIYGNDLIIGQSRAHAISHSKMIVADDCVISGSTNLSGSGEAKQNNECTATWDARMAIEAAAKIGMIFAEMQAQPNSKRFSALLALPTIIPTSPAG